MTRLYIYNPNSEFFIDFLPKAYNLFIFDRYLNIANYIDLISRAFKYILSHL